MTDPLITAEEKEHLASFAKPAVPASEKVPAAEPAKEPEPPAVEEEPEVEEPEGDELTLDDLVRAQNETLAAVGKLAETLVAKERAKGDTREEEEILAELQDESPAVRRLYEQNRRIEKAINALTEQNEERRQLEVQSQQVNALASQYEAEADEVMARFPGLNDKDINKVFDWMEKHPQEVAGRLSFGMAAEKILGYAYLDARRTPVKGPDGGKPPAPPSPSPAKVVTETVAGSGARPAASAPTTGDVRDAFAEIRRDPSALGALGSYSSR